MTSVPCKSTLLNVERVTAFEAGYQAALTLVEAECRRPALQKLALHELALLLRRQTSRQSQLWQQDLEP